MNIDIYFQQQTIEPNKKKNKIKEDTRKFVAIKVMKRPTQNLSVHHY